MPGMIKGKHLKYWVDRHDSKVVYIKYLLLLPARASEQGNVIGLVSVYICTYVRSCHQKKIVIERTRDLIYLQFVLTDFSPKIISPSACENSGDLA